MKAKTKRRIKLVSFRAAGASVAIGLPAWAILAKFPVWRTETGTLGMLGMGGIMIAVVALVTFKRTVLDFIKEKTGMKTSPPLAVWGVLLIASFILSAFAELLSDMRGIFIAGLVGSGVGTVLNIIGDRLSEKRDNCGDVSDG